MAVKGPLQLEQFCGSMEQGKEAYMDVYFALYGCVLCQECTWSILAIELWEEA